MFHFNGNDNQGGNGCKTGLSRKQQAISDREVELIQLAKSIIQEQGVTNLTMDKVTAASQYSKGTIYNHFCSKEDLVVALCQHTMKYEIALFSRVKSFKGSTREKVLALHVCYQIYIRMEPVASMLIMISKSPWITEKASEERVKERGKLEKKLFEIAYEIIDAAVKKGDLQYSSGMGADAVLFANWSLLFGANALAQTARSECIDQMESRYSALFNANVLLDGLRWQPLSTEWDYHKSWQRIEKELFSEELAHLKTVGC